MTTSLFQGKSTFIIVRPESEDYSRIFSLSEEKARVVNGTPIIDLHLTVQAIRNVDDFAAMKKRLKDYCAHLRPFEITVRNIARMNVNNQQGRLWMLAEKNSCLEKMYEGLANIASEMGCEAYPYKAQNWLPHIKIVELPENTSPQIKDPTFGVGNGITFTIRNFEWTVQRGAESWELIDRFSFPE